MTGRAVVEINARQIADLVRALGPQRLGELLVVLQQRIDGLPGRLSGTVVPRSDLQRDLHRWRGSATSLGLTSVAAAIEAAEQCLVAEPAAPVASPDDGRALAPLAEAVTRLRGDLQASIDELAGQIPGLVPGQVPGA